MSLCRKVFILSLGMSSIALLTACQTPRIEDRGEQIPYDHLVQTRERLNPENNQKPFFPMFPHLGYTDTQMINAIDRYIRTNYPDRIQ
ncbi:MAG: hypothetical protein ACMXYG_07325 [Candidatus Woesearchaeota archaeon]